MTRALLISVLAGAALAPGCGAGFRADAVGTARTTLGPLPAGERVLLAVPLADPGDRHELDVRIDLPRAVAVVYAVACQDLEHRGQAGETWAAYRERRLAELAQARRNEQAMVQSVVGAAVGRIGGGAAVAAPGVEGEVSAQVDGEAGGGAVAEHVVAPVELDPRDTGARVHRDRVSYQPPAGTSRTVGGPDALRASPSDWCTLAVWSELPDQDLGGVIAELTVTRLVDVGRERAAAAEQRRQVALVTRAELTAALVAGGADPHRVARERAAEPERLRRERERAAERELLERERARRHAADRAKWERAERRVRAERERRRLRGAFVVERIAFYRRWVYDGLCRGGADPGKRERDRLEAERLRHEANRATELRAEADRVRRARAVAFAFELRGRLVADLIAGGADPDYRRHQFEDEVARHAAEEAERERARQAAAELLALQTEEALALRADLKLRLRDGGAFDRPSRPAPPLEEPPPAPHPGAIWVGGQYAWAGIDWEWRPGYWADPPTATAIWVAPVEIIIRGATVTRPGAWVNRRNGKVIRRDHR